MSKTSQQYIENVSEERAAAIAALLINNRISFTSKTVEGAGPKPRVDLGVSVDNAAHLREAIRVVHQAKTEKISLITDVNSAEQASSHANGTLSNVAPGLAITVQVSPSFKRENMTQQEALAVFPEMFLPLAVRGWNVELILGRDLDV